MKAGRVRRTMLVQLRVFDGSRPEFNTVRRQPTRLESRRGAWPNMGAYEFPFTQRL